MSNDKAETGRNSGAAATDEQVIEHDANGVPVPAGTERPWTSDFELPSIRFREPAEPKS